MTVDARRSAVVPVEKKVLMAAWMLANQDPFRSIGNLFGMSRGSAHYCVFQVCQALRSVKADYIKWPSSEEYVSNAATVEQKYAMPNVAGCKCASCM